MQPTVVTVEMKRVIVNADDLGLTVGINRAIFEAHHDGLVTAASLIANGAAFDDAIAWLRDAPALCVGLHVNLVEGRPLADGARSLIDRTGYFRSLLQQAARLSCGAISTAELERELNAQAERVRAAGITITHLDSHRNLHLHPRMARALSGLAVRLGVRWIRFQNQRPIMPRVPGAVGIRDRVDHAAGLIGSSQSRWSREGPATKRYIVGAPGAPDAPPAEMFRATAGQLPDGITEWVFHPGYVDDDLRAVAKPKYVARREAERLLLIDPTSRRLLEEANIKLTSYRELAG